MNEFADFLVCGRAGPTNTLIRPVGHLLPQAGEGEIPDEPALPESEVADHLAVICFVHKMFENVLIRFYGFELSQLIENVSGGNKGHVSRSPYRHDLDDLSATVFGEPAVAAINRLPDPPGAR